MPQTRARRPDRHHRLADLLQAPFCALLLDLQIAGLFRADHYASKYVPAYWRTVNPDEKEARRIVWGLKAGADEAIQKAAPTVAALIDGPCWLSPSPRQRWQPGG